MSNKIKIIEQDLIFLSYDEPNAEKNYADLVSKAPWAKRVHGVKGSDAAHKACAALSETEYFVTVDADNIVDPDFFNLEIDLEKLGLDDTYVFSWCGKVYVNNLMYGNGGLKLWTRQFVKNMKTHENSESTDIKNLVEFCFDDKYYQFDSNYSTSYTNGSPFQAWRAGFREGVKMSLSQGEKVNNLKDIWWKNKERLRIWCSVGADTVNGIWSILGAREGCYLTNCTDWDYSNVRDFDYLTDYWNTTYKDNLHLLTQKSDYYLNFLNQELDLKIVDLSDQASLFFKSLYSNAPRGIRRNQQYE
jgi:hypothetical protein